MGFAPLWVSCLGEGGVLDDCGHLEEFADYQDDVVVQEFDDVGRWVHAELSRADDEEATDLAQKPWDEPSLPLRLASFSLTRKDTGWRTLSQARWIGFIGNVN